MQRITRSVFLHMEISWQLHCLNVVMYLYYYMFPAGFKYILQIKFLIDLNPGSAISVPAKHWYNVLVLCFKEQLLFHCREPINVFPPQWMCRTWSNPEEWEHGSTTPGKLHLQGQRCRSSVTKQSPAALNDSTSERWMQRSRQEKLKKLLNRLRLKVCDRSRVELGERRGLKTSDFEHQETLFSCEGDQTLAQLAQGGCGVSLLEIFKIHLDMTLDILL